MSKGYTTIIYEGDGNVKLPSKARILSSNTANDLITSLAVNCTIALAEDANCDYNNDQYVDMFEEMIEYFKKIKRKMELSKYTVTGQLIKFESNRTIPVEEQKENKK